MSLSAELLQDKYWNSLLASALPDMSSLNMELPAECWQQKINLLITEWIEKHNTTFSWLWCQSLTISVSKHFTDESSSVLTKRTQTCPVIIIAVLYHSFILFCATIQTNVTIRAIWIQSCSNGVYSPTRIKLGLYHI